MLVKLFILWQAIDFCWENLWPASHPRIIYFPFSAVSFFFLVPKMIPLLYFLSYIPKKFCSWWYFFHFFFFFIILLSKIFEYFIAASLFSLISVVISLCNNSWSTCKMFKSNNLNVSRWLMAKCCGLARVQPLLFNQKCSHFAHPTVKCTAWARSLKAWLNVPVGVTFLRQYPMA